MYSTKETSLKAYEQFKAKTTEYNHSELNTLETVLKDLDGYQPSKYLRTQWTNQWGHEENVPEQLHRDMKIVDMLHRHYNMSFKRATSLWCDWEDYEYDLIEGAGIY